MADTISHENERFALDRRAAFEHLKANVRDAAPRNEAGGIVYTTLQSRDHRLVGVFVVDQRSLEPVDLSAAIAATEGWRFVTLDGRPALIAPPNLEVGPETAAIEALREILQDGGFRHVRV